MRAKFLASARGEFLKEVGYYNEKALGLGAALVQEVEDATARALAFPESGSPGPAGTRFIVVNKFPFSLVYRLDREGIVVFALAHHKREPEYWVSRV
jgi:toxin ParE1/3/4